MCGKGRVIPFFLGLNPMYAGKGLPDKALRLQGIRIVSAFPMG